MKNIFKYFAQGLFVIIPLGITFLILYKLFHFVTTHLRDLGLAINPYISPFVVLILLLIIILLVGWLASSIFFQSIFNLFEKMIENTPMIKHIYSPVKDFMGAFVGNKKKFTKPVLVLTNPTAGIEEIGFITQEQMNDFGLIDKVAVYMPHSYAFSGRLFIVPKDNIKIISNLNGGEAMKFIVSGGLTDMETKEEK
jgi:uncharacterized membrane protein